MRRDLSQEEGTHPALLDALTAPAIYGESLPVAVHETHASWVFLAGELAYKVKKPVRLAFLDYSTLSLRHAACLEEVAVNHELAPGIYLGVRAILHGPGGFRFASEESAGAVEYAVVMRRFQEAHTLLGAIQAGSLTRSHIQQVAGRLAEFHQRSSALAADGPEHVLDSWMVNVQEIERLPFPSRWRVETMRGFGETFVAAHARELERRVERGLVRDGHGDLRCEHVLLGPQVRVVDRIEFDPALRQMDVARDLAFLAMDLEAHGRRWAARELARAYRHAGGDPGSERLRCFYSAYWALVRAKVALIAAGTHHGALRRRERARAERLWGLAERLCWGARGPVVIVVCGPAASGKSTLAGDLARRSRLPVVSSDVLRKRLAGVALGERARPEHYTEEFTCAVYLSLAREALARLEGRGGVIVDATCHTRRERAALFGLLRHEHATFLAVQCQVTLQTALARAASRMQSPNRVSDATPQVVAAQFHRFQTLDELAHECVLALDCEQSVEAQTTALTRAVDRQIGLRADRQRAVSESVLSHHG
ncbi:MAG TPA: AAA family ATPase [Solirubrobacteraceae bacterium]|jgi:aminoglycoside phosphotransferase family enzyme/predicted kinase|nr:AAA family ATPase [Solirubrobacteraceae bacterium]